MNIIQKIALVFTLIGALNWGLVGLFNFNLGTAIFGTNSVMTTIVYVIVAIAAIINILLFFIPLDYKRNDDEMVYSSSYHHEQKEKKISRRCGIFFYEILS